MIYESERKCLKRTRDESVVEEREEADEHCCDTMGVRAREPICGLSERIKCGTAEGCLATSCEVVSVT